MHELLLETKKMNTRILILAQLGKLLEISSETLGNFKYNEHECFDN